MWTHMTHPSEGRSFYANKTGRRCRPVLFASWVWTEAKRLGARRTLGLFAFQGLEVGL